MKITQKKKKLIVYCIAIALVMLCGYMIGQ